VQPSLGNGKYWLDATEIDRAAQKDRLAALTQRNVNHLVFYFWTFIFLKYNSNILYIKANLPRSGDGKLQVL